MLTLENFISLFTFLFSSIISDGVALGLIIESEALIGALIAYDPNELKDTSRI